MDARGKNFGASFGSRNRDRFSANFENRLLARARRTRDLSYCFSFYGAVSNEPFDVRDFPPGQLVIASLSVLRTIRFLYPPRRENDDWSLRLKSSSSLTESYSAGQSSLSLSLPHPFSFFSFSYEFSVFFSYALNDCCFHGESFRKLSRKPFI